MTLATATLSTPPGPFTLIAGDDGVVASGWAADAAALVAAVGPARVPAAAAAVDAGALRRRGLGPLVGAVRAYLDGDLGALDEVPVAPPGGGPFTRRAWRELRAVPPGAPVAYADLAARCGSPSAVRAAGSACASNRVALFVPCHRVVRGDGGLGGFLYGLDVKRWLLEHEAAGAHAAGGALPAAATARA